MMSDPFGFVGEQGSSAVTLAFGIAAGAGVGGKG
jgi:hypothetical protein